MKDKSSEVLKDMTQKVPKNSKLNKEIVADVCKFIKAGNNYNDSAVMAGISYESFNRWRKKYDWFEDEIRRAEKQYKARLIALVDRSAEHTWQSAAWLLERKYKDEYSLRQEVTGKEGKDLQINIISHIPDEDNRTQLPAPSNSTRSSS